MNKATYKIIYIDDDPIIRELVESTFRKQGHRIKVFSNVNDGIEATHKFMPNCVISDLMIPGDNGLDLCRKIKSIENFSQIKFMIYTVKPYQADETLLINEGADAYLKKTGNVNDLVDATIRLIEDKIVIQFWGTRGSLPVSGKQHEKYGGNTPCVSATFSNEDLIIFDCGTGIKTLGDELMKKNTRIKASIFITHSHWDHINAIPFFSPLYKVGNEFHIYGPPQGDKGIKELVESQMDTVFFPVKTKEFGSHTEYKDLHEEELLLNKIQINTIQLNHPGLCLGYKVKYKNRTFCYFTDNELFRQDSDSYDEENFMKQVAFTHGADVLITDCTYTEDEYTKYVFWGHSDSVQVARLASFANVKKLILFHHNPGQNDEQIDEKVVEVKTNLEKLNNGIPCEAAADNMTIII